MSCSLILSTELKDDFLMFDIIMETATGKRLDTPESLDENTVLLGTGSKGKVIGEATLSLKPGHKGFRAAAAGKNLDNEIERWEKKISKLKTEMEDNPMTRGRLERQINTALIVRLALRRQEKSYHL